MPLGGVDLVRMHNIDNVDVAANDSLTSAILIMTLMTITDMMMRMCLVVLLVTKLLLAIASDVRCEWGSRDPGRMMELATMFLTRTMTTESRFWGPVLHDDGADSCDHAGVGSVGNDHDHLNGGAVEVDEL